MLIVDVIFSEFSWLYLGIQISLHIWLLDKVVALLSAPSSINHTVHIARYGCSRHSVEVGALVHVIRTVYKCIVMISYTNSYIHITGYWSTRCDIHILRLGWFRCIHLCSLCKCEVYLLCICIVRTIYHASCSSVLCREGHCLDISVFCRSYSAWHITAHDRHGYISIYRHAVCLAVSWTRSTYIADISASECHRYVTGVFICCVRIAWYAVAWQIICNLSIYSKWPVVVCHSVVISIQIYWALAAVRWINYYHCRISTEINGLILCVHRYTKLVDIRYLRACRQYLEYHWEINRCSISSCYDKCYCAFTCILGCSCYLTRLKHKSWWKCRTALQPVLHVSSIILCGISCNLEDREIVRWWIRCVLCLRRQNRICVFLTDVYLVSHIIHYNRHRWIRACHLCTSVASLYRLAAICRHIGCVTRHIGIANCDRLFAGNIFDILIFNYIWLCSQFCWCVVHVCWAACIAVIHSCPAAGIYIICKFSCCHPHTFVAEPVWRTLERTLLIYSCPAWCHVDLAHIKQRILAYCESRVILCHIESRKLRISIHNCLGIHWITKPVSGQRIVKYCGWSLVQWHIIRYLNRSIYINCRTVIDYQSRCRELLIHNIGSSDSYDILAVSHECTGIFWCCIRCKSALIYSVLCDLICYGSIHGWIRQDIHSCYLTTTDIYTHRIAAFIWKFWILCTVYCFYISPHHGDPDASSYGVVLDTCYRVLRQISGVQRCLAICLSILIVVHVYLCLCVVLCLDDHWCSVETYSLLILVNYDSAILVVLFLLLIWDDHIQWELCLWTISSCHMYYDILSIFIKFACRSDNLAIDQWESLRKSICLIDLVCNLALSCVVWYDKICHVIERWSCCVFFSKQCRWINSCLGYHDLLSCRCDRHCTRLVRHAERVHAIWFNRWIFRCVALTSEGHLVKNISLVHGRCYLDICAALYICTVRVNKLWRLACHGVRCGLLVGHNI